jgi:hypothetical protein
MEKPQILSDKQILHIWETGENIDPFEDFSRVAQAQLDADVGYYHLLLEQAQADGYDAGIKAIESELEEAKAGVAREIFEEIDRLIERVGLDDTITIPVLNAKGYQSLKSKYGGQK